MAAKPSAAGLFGLSVHGATCDEVSRAQRLTARKNIRATNVGQERRLKNHAIPSNTIDVSHLGIFVNLVLR
jgi:hypothetical protein